MVKELTEKEDNRKPSEKRAKYFRGRFFPFISIASARETLAGKNYAGFFRVVLNEDGTAYVLDTIKLKKEK